MSSLSDAQAEPPTVSKVESTSGEFPRELPRNRSPGGQFLAVEPNPASGRAVFKPAGRRRTDGWKVRFPRRSASGNPCGRERIRTTRLAPAGRPSVLRFSGLSSHTCRYGRDADSAVQGGLRSTASRSRACGRDDPLGTDPIGPLRRSSRCEDDRGRRRRSRAVALCCRPSLPLRFH